MLGGASRGESLLARREWIQHPKLLCLVFIRTVRVGGGGGGVEGGPPEEPEERRGRANQPLKNTFFDMHSIGTSLLP